MPVTNRRRRRPLRGHHIVVVDQDGKGQRTLRRALEALGAAVTVVTPGLMPEGTCTATAQTVWLLTQIARHALGD